MDVREEGANAAKGIHKLDPVHGVVTSKVRNLCTLYRDRKMSFKSKRVVPWLFLHACHSVHILKPKGISHHAANVRFNAL